MGIALHDIKKTATSDTLFQVLGSMKTISIFLKWTESS